MEGEASPEPPAAETVLADAAEHEDWATISGLLAAGADVDAAQVDGMTALHWAVWHDAAGPAAALIDAGADVSVENSYQVTPLSLACVNGNAAIVRTLLAAGADPNTTLPGGESVLMTAARTGKVEPVEALLEYGATIDARDRREQTALMWAAAEGNTQVVQQLIEAGADVHATLASGFTPMLFAVREGHRGVVHAMMAAGVDINAAVEPRREMRKGLKPSMSPLLLAVENGHFELAVDLLEAGADPNDQRSGFTALHVLTWVRKPDRGDDGDPAPIGSGGMSSLQFVEAIVQHGADVNAYLTNGRKPGKGKISVVGATPFFLAARRDDVPYMNLLLKLGADPFAPNEHGCTPLMVAAGVGTTAPTEEAGTEDEAIEAVRLLLSLGAVVNTVDANGETAMHGAAYKSLPRMVALLGEHGADVDIWNRKNKYGWTPLLIAEGYRPGNFKPSAETIAAISKVMREAGVEPITGRKPETGNDY